MRQRASVFCNFYIRVDREALVSERALNVGSVAFKAMSTKRNFCISLEGPLRVDTYNYVPTSVHNRII
jgi:hypothetical protein